MRATSMIRYVIFGAVGFGIGGAIYGPSSLLLPGMAALPLAVLISGALGGISLGLASNDSRPTALLALHGAGGVLLGVPIGVSLGSFFDYSEVAIAAFVGATVGAMLGMAFGGWRTIAALALAGAVGFGVGYWLVQFMRASIPILIQLGKGGSIVITGIIGGAFLGAALGYAENRRLSERQRPRVR